MCHQHQSAMLITMTITMRLLMMTIMMQVAKEIETKSGGSISWRLMTR